jgi:molecular chaperone GrpE
MSDETAEQNTESAVTDETDDSRFEVKWRKKETSSPPPPPTDAPSEEPDGSALREELEAANARIRDLQDRWQRAQADLVNLRRRTEQEKGEVEQFASMLLIQEILPVLDNFDRALKTIPDSLRMFTWIQGVMLMERHLQSVLERQGLTTIDAMGQPFNPHLHEAVAERETGESAPGTVVTELQRGYTMHGRVIRPTLVELAKAPAATPTEPQPQTTDPDDTAVIVEQADSENVGP